MIFQTTTSNTTKVGRLSIRFSSLEHRSHIILLDCGQRTGLGTSTPAEAKEYFSAFDRHVRMFEWQSEEDDDLLDMAFEKTRVAVSCALLVLGISHGIFSQF